jgi:uncharacterized protein (TIGR03663 family)
MGFVLALSWFVFINFIRLKNDNLVIDLRFHQWLVLMVIFWLIQVLFFTTILHNVRQGLTSGIAGSLGYWLTQHGVARGSQPWYYYVMLISLYEFLPFALSLAAFTKLFSRLRNGQESTVKASTRPISFQQETLFGFFCAWWFLGSLLVYSVAGEKMPWLLMHVVFPMCLFGSWWLDRWLVSVDWNTLMKQRALFAFMLIPGCFLLFLILPNQSPFQGRTLGEIEVTMAWGSTIIVACCLIWLLTFVFKRVDRQQLGRVVGGGFLLLLLVLTVRFTYLLNFVHDEYAKELLVYAHATPGIKKLTRGLESLRRSKYKDKDTLVVYDSESAWPLTWYMRSFPHRFIQNYEDFTATNTPVLVSGPKYVEKVRLLVADDYEEIRSQLVWWPLSGYKDLTVKRLKELVGTQQHRSDLWRAFYYREYPGKSVDLWPYRTDMFVFVKKEDWHVFNEGWLH